MPETQHTLREYLAALTSANLLASHTIPDEALATPIALLSYDSRQVVPGTLFICKGAQFRASFLVGALQAGAVCYVADTAVADTLAAADAAIADAPRMVVTDIRAALIVLADTGFDHVADRLTIAGITGTKGKSTTTYFLRYILDEYLADIGKPPCAYLSSIDNYDGLSTTEAHLTTPEVLELYRHLQNAADAGITHVSMEVSSQALMCGRVNGITFAVGTWLNIDTDHISPIEHASFQDYFDAKKKLFDRCRVGCVNTDAEHAEEALAYARQRCPVITFGHHEDDDVSCRHVERRADGIHFEVVSEAYNGEFAITMPGMFNVTNALAAMAMSQALGIPEDCVRRGLLRGRATGRMQVYASRDGAATVIVDYAHNRLSFQALYDSTVAEYPGHKLIWIFGCPGNHAQNRRIDLPGVIGDRCDFVYICEEDSGNEPFEAIAADIVANTRSPYAVIEDRGECVRRAIFDFTGPRVILFTGKGEEHYMKRAGRYDDCPSDVDLTLQYLAEYDSRS